MCGIEYDRYIKVPSFSNYEEAEKKGFMIIKESAIKGSERNGFYTEVRWVCLKAFYFEPKKYYFTEGELVEPKMKIYL